MPTSLTADQETARKLLIGVAKGTLRTRRTGLIGYQELWNRIYPRATWSRGRTGAVVDLITSASAFEVEEKRPPLNVLVVPSQAREPKQSWQGIKSFLRRRTGVTVPYRNHQEAQLACWNYWNLKQTPATVGRAKASDKEIEAEEGDENEKTVAFRKRNRWLIKARKDHDDGKCKACGFRLEVRGRFIVDVHHLKPLSIGPGLRVTNIDELVCLCPSCHRIAHRGGTSPLTIEQIRVERRRLPK